jgi:hypothetical protein
MKKLFISLSIATTLFISTEGVLKNPPIVVVPIETPIGVNDRQPPIM